MFDFPGGADRFTGYTNRDSIYTVNSYGFDPKEWIPTDGPLPSSDPFYAGDYAPHVMGDKVVFTTGGCFRVPNDHDTYSMDQQVAGSH